MRQPLVVTVVNKESALFKILRLGIFLGIAVYMIKSFPQEMFSQKDIEPDTSEKKFKFSDVRG